MSRGQVGAGRTMQELVNHVLELQEVLRGREKTITQTIIRNTLRTENKHHLLSSANTPSRGFRSSNLGVPETHHPPSVLETHNPI